MELLCPGRLDEARWTGTTVQATHTGDGCGRGKVEGDNNQRPHTTQEWMQWKMDHDLMPDDVLEEQYFSFRQLWWR